MRKNVFMPDLPLPAAIFWNNTGNFALGVGALLVLTGTILAIWTGGIKERYADIRIAANERATEEAKRDAANADARAAEANKLAEQEKIERLKLEAQFAWRRLGTRKNDLAAFLKQKPSRINIVVVANDPEAAYFADDFSKVFIESGWTVNFVTGTYPDNPIFGVLLDNNGGVETNGLLSDLKSLGIECSLANIPHPPMSFGLINATYPSTLLIGSRFPG